MPTKRKTGPKPKYREPVKVSFLVEAELIQRLDEWAAKRGLKRSVAVQRAIKRLLGRK